MSSGRGRARNHHSWQTPRVEGLSSMQRRFNNASPSRKDNRYQFDESPRSASSAVPSPPQASFQPFSMSSKKRSAGSDLRGTSPPDKRPKPPAAPTGAPSWNASSSPTITTHSVSRHPSRSDYPNAPLGPDRGTNHRSIDGDGSDGRRDSLSLRKASVDGRSPLDTTVSPLPSYGDGFASNSGNSTPVQVAPTVPSMATTATVATTPSNDPQLISLYKTFNNVVQAEHVINAATKAESQKKVLSQNAVPNVALNIGSLEILRRRKAQHADKALNRHRVDAQIQLVQSKLTIQFANAIGAPKVAALEREIERLKKELTTVTESLRKELATAILQRDSRTENEAVALDSRLKGIVQQEIQAALKQQLREVLKDGVKDQVKDQVRLVFASENAEAKHLQRDIEIKLAQSRRDILREVDEITPSSSDLKATQREVSVLRSSIIQLDDANVVGRLSTLIKDERQTYDKLKNHIESCKGMKYEDICAMKEDIEANKAALGNCSNTRKSVDEVMGKLNALELKVDSLDEAQSKTALIEIPNGLAKIVSEALPRALEPTETRLNILENRVTQVADNSGPSKEDMAEAITKSVSGALLPTEGRLVVLENRANKCGTWKEEIPKVISEALLRALSPIEHRLSTLEGRAAHTDSKGSISKDELSSALVPVQTRLSTLEKRGTPATTKGKISKGEISKAVLEFLPGLTDERFSALEDRVTHATNSLKNANEETSRLISEALREALVPTGDRLNALEDQAKQARVDISELNKALEEVETTVARHDADITTLRNDVPNFILQHVEGNFNPFKVAAEQNFQDVNDELVKLTSRVDQNIQTVSLPAPMQSLSPPELTAAHPVINNLAGEISQLRAVVGNAATHGIVQEVAKDISLKLQGVQDQVEIIRHAHRSLEDRYQQITTEDIYCRMVNWLQEAYPNAPGFLDMLRTLQAQIKEVHEQAQRTESKSDQAIVRSNQVKLSISTISNDIVRQLEPLGEAIQQAKRAENKSDEAIARSNWTAKELTELAAKNVQAHTRLNQSDECLGNLMDKHAQAVAESKRIEQSLVNLGTKTDHAIARCSRTERSATTLSAECLRSSDLKRELAPLEMKIDNERINRCASIQKMDSRIQLVELKATKLEEGMNEFLDMKDDMGKTILRVEFQRDQLAMFKDRLKAVNANLDQPVELDLDLGHPNTEVKRQDN